MGATVVVVLLAGLALPVLLVVTAALLDVLACVWALYRMWHDDWGHRTWEFLTLHAFYPVARFVRAHQIVPRPH
jgi:hypothetical protein